MDYTATKNKKNHYKIPLNKIETFEIYIGQNGGKQLQFDIDNAKNEVLIISPYIDEAKLDDLIALKNKNINIQLAFNFLDKKQENNILKKLIHQNKYNDLSKKEKTKKQTELFHDLIMTSLIMTIFLLIYSITKLINSKEINFFFFFSIPFFIIFKWLKKEKKKIEKTVIYNYNYTEKLNFKYLKNSFDEKKIIDSKIYIIDRKIAYLGSINFTENSFYSDFETGIRIDNEEKIKELINFVNNIFEDDINFNKYELDWLGKKVYNETKY